MMGYRCLASRLSTAHAATSERDRCKQRRYATERCSVARLACLLVCGTPRRAFVYKTGFHLDESAFAHEIRPYMSIVPTTYIRLRGGRGRGGVVDSSTRVRGQIPQPEKPMVHWSPTMIPRTLNTIRFSAFKGRNANRSPEGPAAARSGMTKPRE